MRALGGTSARTMAACRRLGVVLAVAAVAAAAPAPPAPPPTSPPTVPPAVPPASGPDALRKVRDDAWAADIDALVAGIAERHVDPFARRPREAFLADAAALKAELPTLSVPQKLAGMARLVASLGDSHTSVALDQLARNAQIVPVVLAWLEDGVFIAAAAPELAPHLGSRVVALGGRPIEEAAARMTAVAAADNAGSTRAKFSQLASSYDLLSAVGLADADGRVTYTLAPGSAGDPAGGDRLSVAPLPRMALPQLVSRPDPKDPSLPVSRRGGRGNYFVVPLPEQEAVYLRFDRCMEDRSVPFADVARAAVDELAKLERPRLVVDLRNNGGGDSRVIAPLLEGLRAARETRPALREPNSVVVLIGPRTLSSASMNAHHLADQLGATLVGQPTGQRPNHLGELRTFDLPGTGLTVWHSTKRFTPFPEGSALAGADGVPPTIVVPVTSADFFAGRDRALETALALPRGE